MNLRLKLAIWLLELRGDSYIINHNDTYQFSDKSTSRIFVEMRDKVREVTKSIPVVITDKPIFFSNFEWKEIITAYCDGLHGYDTYDVDWDTSSPHAVRISLKDRAAKLKHHDWIKIFNKLGYYNGVNVEPMDNETLPHLIKLARAAGRRNFGKSFKIDVCGRDVNNNKNGSINIFLKDA